LKTPRASPLWLGDADPSGCNLWVTMVVSHLQMGYPWL
jgi:hypothetical protein